MSLGPANPAALEDIFDVALPAPAAAPSVTPIRPVLDPRTRLLIEAPIAVTLVRLAAPNMLVMVVQASLGLVETYFIGWLGTAALAGVALVFPAVMLMQMMSAGAVGGGISSAVARALGSGRRDDADRLAVHAIAIAISFAVVFSAATLIGGRALYSAMGGSGAALDAALTYSNIVFAGMVLIWLFNALANIIRGTGNMAVPAGVSIGLTLVLVPLSPCLIFGWGPFPRLGIAGGGTALILYYVIGVTVLGWYLASGRSVVRLRLSGWRLEARLFKEILRVGAVAALITVQTNATVAMTTALVGRFGPAAIAGYGVGSRLEYLLVPLVFGLGGPLVAMVGTNIGAGRGGRALRTRLDRRRDRLCLDRNRRAGRGGAAARLADPVRPRPDDAGRRRPVSARRGAVLWAFRSRHGALFRFAGSRPAALAVDGGGHPFRDCGGRRLAGLSADQRFELCLHRACHRAYRVRLDQCRRGRRRRLVRQAGEVRMLYFEDFAVGQIFATGQRRVDASEIVEFAAKYDPQPFHLDAEAAKTSLFGGLAASGWHSAAMMMRLVARQRLPPGRRHYRRRRRGFRLAETGPAPATNCASRSEIMELRQIWPRPRARSTASSRSA